MTRAKVSISFDWKLNNRGFNELRNDPAVVADLDTRGARVVEAAGSKHHKHETRKGRRRPRVTIWTWTNTGKQRQAENHNLTRAVDAAR